MGTSRSISAAVLVSSRWPWPNWGRGFSAIDSSEKLLKYLAAHIGSRAITARQGDLLELDCLVAPASVDVAVCMGDTLSHLSSRNEISLLFQAVHRALKPGGTFIVTYRDLANGELLGLDRFIPVYGDEQRVMTCFLEYEGPDTVVVHDLISILEPDGHWTLRKSSYRKLRLSIDWVLAEMAAAGLPVITQRPGRLLTIGCHKPLVLSRLYSLAGRSYRRQARTRTLDAARQRHSPLKWQARPPQNKAAMTSPTHKCRAYIPEKI